MIRLGYGISYDPLPMSRVFRDPYPLTIPQSFVGPNTYTPFASLRSGIPPLPFLICLRARSCSPTTVISRSPFPGLLHRGYIQSYNFTIERQLPGAFLVSAAFVGTATTHQFVDHELNAVLRAAELQGFRYSALGRSVSTLFEDGWLSSHYNSLQIGFNRRFTGGLC